MKGWLPLLGITGAILLAASKAWGAEYPSAAPTSPSKGPSKMPDVSSGTFTRDMVDWGDFKQGSPTVALVVGHSKEDQGAEARVNGKLYSEWTVMEPLARKIRYLMPDGINTPIFLRQKYNQYISENRFIDRLGPDVVVRLHMNNYKPKTSGLEVLYFVNSVIGKKLAEELAPKLASILGIKNRGAKALKRGDRASHLLYDVKAPAIIGENGFIPEDIPEVLANIDKLAGAYATVLYNHLKDKINVNS